MNNMRLKYYVYYAVVILSIMASSIASVQAQGEALQIQPTISWVSDTNGFWDDPANWRDSSNVARLPNSSDDVLIDRGAANPIITLRSGDQIVHSFLSNESLSIISGSLAVAAPSELNSNFTLSNATLVVNGTLTTTGNSSWNSGVIRGSAILTNTGTITLSGADTKFLGGVLNNSGTVIHKGGNLQLDIFVNFVGNFVGTLNNQAGGVYDLQADAIFSFQSLVGAINNSGTFRKSQGTGTASVSNIPFNNTGGTVNVESGIFSLTRGNHSGGTFSAGNGATLKLTGTHTLTGTYTGSGNGAVEFTGGNFNVGAGGAIFNFPNGLLQWVDGRLDGGADGLTNLGTATVVRGGNAAFTLLNKVTNAGTIINSGVMKLEIDGSAILTNLPGALIDYQGDGFIIDVSLRAGPHKLINQGTIRKSSGSISNLNVSGFNTDGGTIDVLSGTLTLGAGSNTGGTFKVDAGATLDLTGGNTVTYAGTYTGSGQGNVVVGSGILAVGTNGATFNLPSDMFHWTGGAINGGAAGLTNTGIITLAGAGTKFLGGVLSNAGTILHTAGSLQLDFELGQTGIAGTLNNQGVYDILFDVNFTHPLAIPAAIHNSGTMRKSAGVGTAAIRDGLLFDNTGIVEVNSGILALKATDGSLNPVIAQISGNTLTGGTWNVRGNSTLTLPATITTSQANITLDGSNSTLDAISGLNSNSGSFNLLGGRSFTSGSGFSNSGSLTLGPGSKLNISGNYTQTSAASLMVQIGGSSASGQFGRITSTGNDILDGTLNVALANGFGPTLGDSFPVLSFAAHTGSFAAISGLNLGRFPLFAANVSATAVTLDAQMTTSDLAVTDVQIIAPSTSPGQSTTVRYTVNNQSSTPATGDWYDSIYLSTDNSVDPQDVLLGRIHHTGGAAGLTSYTETLTAPVPALLERGYRVIVLSDSRGLVPDANRANNTGLSTGTLSVTIPTLSIGGSVTETITNDQDVYYRLVIPPGEDLTISAKYTATPEAEMYLRYGTLPDRTNFDRTASDINNLNPQITLSDAQGGDYYILLHGREGAANAKNFTLSAQNQEFQILSFYPNTSLNHADETITLEGTKFTPNTNVSLVAANGSVFPAGSVSLIDSDHLSATFDLSAMPPDSYTVQAQDGQQRSTASTLFTVSNEVAGNFSSITILSPAHVRVGEAIPVNIDIHGSDVSFVPVPFIQVEASNVAKGQESQQLVDPELPLFLKPGQNMSLGIIYDPQPHQDAAISNFNLQLVSLIQIIDWDRQKDLLRPAGVPADAWDAVWANLRPKLGSIVGDFYKLLWQSGKALKDNGVTTNSVARLFNFEESKANNQLPLALLEQAVDVAFPTTGLSMAFERSFLGTVVGRYRLGRLGRGWVDNFDISATTDTTVGLVTIQDGSLTRYFRRQADGSFKATVGDYGTLTEVNGAYRLREKGGALTTFHPNGSLDFIQDTNNNRITANYTGTQLTSLIHSDGAIMTIDYNDQGRIRQVTDHAGRLATYFYDPSGEHISSVTTVNGATIYNYTADTSGPRAHSLASITRPDGTHMFFDYDNEGRLESQRRDGNAEKLIFSYGLASFRMTDAQNNSTTFFYDDAGHILRTQDALGHLSYARYDNLNNLLFIRPEGNGPTTFSPDPKGNVHLAFNPLGAKQTFTYDPTFNRIVSWIDELNNQMTFGQDTNGNQNSIIYADNSSETFKYDAQGNLERAVDRNGKVTLYTYTNNGLLKTRQLSDGSLTTYDYDAHTNLHTVTDDIGIITLDYDLTTDRLSKITYPNGRSITYNYLVGGQLKQIIDQSGFTVNYGYDTVGNLATLTDGGGKLIVQYSYNELGQLKRKDNANGTFTTYEYDANGHLIHLINFAPDNGVNSRFDYTYDILGRRKLMTTLEGTTTYSYNGDGRLTSVILPNNSRTITYQYDAAGNRRTVADNGVTTGYTINNLNQYTAVGGITHNYDSAGNLIYDGNASYTYDALNRLIGVTNASGTRTYEYDALGNLSVMVQNGRRTEYLIDPTGLGNVLSEYDGSGQLIAHYIQGLGLTSRVNTASGAAFYDFDGAGSTVGMTDSSGNYVNRYINLPFGEIVSSSENVPNPFKYNGAVGVMDNGSGLNFMRARFYNSNQGRFIQPDPIGLAGGSNLYEYAINNPVSFVDASGYDVKYTGTAGEVGVLTASTYHNSSAQTYGAGIGVTSISAEPFAGPPVGGLSLSVDIGLGPLGGTVKLDESGKWQFSSSGFLNKINLLDPLSPLKSLWEAKSISQLWRAKATINYTFGAPLPPVRTWDFNPYCQSDPSKCFPLTPAHLAAVTSTQQVGSRDPNFLSGPSGFGPTGFTMGETTYPYYIAFENQASAGAPAQQVIITQQLDPNLDLNTFQLSDFGFGNLKVDVPMGRQVYSTRIDKRDDFGVFVDVTAALNAQTRIVTWTFTALDPRTLDLPSDPLVGFLPPDKNTPQGEGFVSYSIRPKTGLATGTPINAQASIIFDVNAPIATNTFLNTIDADSPSSRVTALPPNESSVNFSVNWSGSDGAGSGIATFDIFVSTDGGTFQPFLLNTTDTSAVFTGQDGHTYGFYSVATDNVGRREADRSTADTTTKVQVATALVARDDAATTVEGKAVTIAVLNNDTDTAGNPLTVKNVNTPAHGAVVLNLDGTLTYTPIQGFFGNDSFTYQATDGQLDSNLATVNVTVLPAELSVISFTPTASGFRVRFSEAIDPTPLNLYDTTSAHLGPADVTLVGASSGAVSGSLVLDADLAGFIFIRVGGPLASDTYTVTLVSGASGFKDSQGKSLDGNGDGITGDNYTTHFSIGPLSAVRLGIPDFMRGLGQVVNIPATAKGIPIILTSAGGVRKVGFTLHYDPALLSITDVVAGASLPATATVTSDLSHAGTVHITIDSPITLAASALELVNLRASVPSAARYGAAQILDLTDIVVNDSTVVAIDDDGVHLAGFFGDTNANRKYDLSDANNIRKVATKIDSGFAAYPLISPIIIADINRDGNLGLLDATKMLQEALGFNQPEIPSIPPAGNAIR